VPVRILVDDAPRDDRPAALQRPAQLLQLLRREAQLELQVLQLGRAGLGEMPQQRIVLMPLELRPAEWVEQPRNLLRDEQALAAVDREGRVPARAELAEPGVLRPRPLSETRALGRVRLLVAGREQARQGGVGRPGKQAAVEQELLGLVERLKRAVGRQAALVRPPVAQLLDAGLLGYSPITWTNQRRSRSWSSSTKITRCQWPRQRLPSRSGIVSLAPPISIERQWA
jgi:hypothetical protein